MIAWTLLCGPAHAGAVTREPAAPPAAAAEPAAPEAPAGPDRSHPPTVAPPPVLELPEPELHPLHPGVDAWFVRVPGVRKVSVEVVFDRGMVELLHNPTMVGRATGWLVDAAGGTLDGAAFSEAEDLHQLDVWSDMDLHEARVGVLAPKEELSEGLRLLSLCVRSPAYPKQEVKRWVLDQRQYYLVDAPASQGILADAGLSYGWFEPGHPYGARPDLSQLDLVDDKALDATWARVTHESPATVVVVGDVAWSDVEPAIRAMVDGLGTEGPASQMLLFDPPTTTRVLAVDLPGQAQAAVRLRTAAPFWTADDFPAMIVTNFVYGGHFQSRLNSNLREEKGWTYGANSWLSGSESYGLFTISVDVPGEHALDTMREIEKELARMTSEPVSDEELESARRTLVANWNRYLETADAAAGLYDYALDHHVGTTALRARQERVYAVTADQAMATAATWLGADRPRLWVVVGDRAALEPQLAELGLPVRWVAPADMALGRL